MRGVSMADPLYRLVGREIQKGIASGNAYAYRGVFDPTADYFEGDVVRYPSTEAEDCGDGLWIANRRLRIPEGETTADNPCVLSGLLDNASPWSGVNAPIDLYGNQGDPNVAQPDSSPLPAQPASTFRDTSTGTVYVERDDGWTAIGSGGGSGVGFTFVTTDQASHDDPPAGEPGDTWLEILPASLDGFNPWFSEGEHVPDEIVVPTTPNGHFYQDVTDGLQSSATLEPDWPVDGSTVIDGGVEWQDRGLISDQAASQAPQVTLFAFAGGEWSHVMTGEFQYGNGLTETQLYHDENAIDLMIGDVNGTGLGGVRASSGDGITIRFKECAIAIVENALDIFSGVSQVDMVAVRDSEADGPGMAFFGADDVVLASARAAIPVQVDTVNVDDFNALVAALTALGFLVPPE